MDTLGERLKYIREKAGYNKEQVMNLLQISNLGRYESDQRKPSLDTLILLAKHYGVSIDWIVLGEDTSSLELSPPRETSWYLNENQKKVANDFFNNLTLEQVALLNNYEKLNPEGKRATQKFITFTLKEQNELEQEPPAISKGLA